MGRGEPELNLREKADYDGKNIVHAVCWGTCPQKALRCSRGILPFSHKIRGCFEKFTLPLRSRAHLVDYGNHAHPMAATPISTTPPGPCSWTPSGRPGDGGDPSGRSRQCVGLTRGGELACRLTFRLPVDPDGDVRCRLREPQVGARAKTASRVATAHHQTPAARLQGGGPDLDRGQYAILAFF